MSTYELRIRSKNGSELGEGPLVGRNLGRVQVNGVSFDSMRRAAAEHPGLLGLAVGAACVSLHLDEAKATSPEQSTVTNAIRVTPKTQTDRVFLQYGVAFATEASLSPGPLCDTPAAPCALGSGGGIVLRGGSRSPGPIYFGAAYEITKQDSNKIYRLGLLQQVRAEGRYYVETSRIAAPYALLGLGVTSYGNEWSIDTFGPSASAGVGLEYQLSRGTVVGFALAYRAHYLSRFTDSAGAERNAGIAQMLGVDILLEQRDTLLLAPGKVP